jgi:hypothetical protein
MGLFDTLMETFSDAPEWKGKRFEKFVIDKFDPNYFTIVEQTHSWQTNQKRFVESSLNPDYILRYNRTKEEFAVECKYRSSLNPKGMLEYTNPQQFERYKEFMQKRKIPVYVVVGFGGVDDYPDDLFVLPLNEMKYPTLYPSVFKQYSKNPNNMFYWKNGVLS